VKRTCLTLPFLNGLIGLTGSIGTLLKSCGLRTTSIKIDPYLNVDAGTMSPLEHGEVFVLDDGGETDLDLVSAAAAGTTREYFCRAVYEHPLSQPHFRVVTPLAFFARKGQL